MDQIENLIEIYYRELEGYLNSEYVKLYSCFESEKLKIMLSTLHFMFVDSFTTMNSRLPTVETEAHFWADPSRYLLKAIECSENLQEGLRNSKYAFKEEPYYKDVLDRCKTFLSPCGGSSIPPHMQKIKPYYTIPIFLKENSVEIKNLNDSRNYNLKLNTTKPHHKGRVYYIWSC